MGIHDAVSAAVTSARGRIGVACSGGADSIALADAAIEIAGAARVVVLTIDHGLHADSARIASEVAAWARGRGAVAAVRRVDVERRASIEAAARDARYAALAELAAEHALAAVWLAHTARDQAETVLMRVLRGTGPAGLAGIPARRDGGDIAFVRPLLAIERAAIDAYVRERALPIWDDPMNRDPAITRVRIRERILPLLREENPALDAALVRIADSAAEWLEVIDSLAGPFSRFPIDCAALARQPAAIRKRAVAVALAAAELDADASHLDAIDRLVTAPARGTIAIDVRGGTLARTYDSLDLAGVAVTPAPLVAPAGYTIRVWEPGDRMRPARLHGHSRKLSDCFIDAKVPRADRARARVIVRGDGTIVWAEHIGIAHDDVLHDGERELFCSISRSTATPAPT